GWFGCRLGASGLGRLRLAICQWLLGIAVLQPVLKLSHADLGDRTTTGPAIGIVGVITGIGVFERIKAYQHLMLIESAIVVHLIDDKHPLTVLIPTQGHIDLIAIGTGCALHVTVVVGHFGFPLGTIFGRAGAL